MFESGKVFLEAHDDAVASTGVSMTTDDDLCPLGVGVGTSRSSVSIGGARTDFDSEIGVAI
jgi:hypothetical protein